MNLSLIGWLFALGVTLHNIEEAIFLPKWSKQAGRWHSPVQPAVFRFAVAILSIAALLAAWLAAVGGPGSFGAYFIAGYALTEGYVDLGVFLYSGPITVLCILASIPLLFALGRKLNLQ